MAGDYTPPQYPGTSGNPVVRGYSLSQPFDGSSGPLLMASSTLGLAPGRVGTEEDMPNRATRDIAAALGRQLRLPVESMPADQAQAHLGWMGMFFGADAPASNTRTRALLGWEDIAAGHYPGD